MRILVTAFACNPERGSEHGLGWRWSQTAAQLGHEILVITQSEARAAIDEAMSRATGLDNLNFDYYMPNWLGRFKSIGLKTRFQALTLHLSHLAWQFGLYFHVKRHLDFEHYDAVHHLTYSGIRHPTLMGHLSIPLVLGPVGGGERAPYRLRRSIPTRYWIRDAARDLHTLLLRIDPITRSACRRALIVYTKTEETKQALPFAPRVAVRLEIGIDRVHRPNRSLTSSESLRLLYAGRFLPLKGMHLGLKAVAKARQRGADLKLTMVGSGPVEQSWRRLAAQLRLEDIVRWVPWVEHNRMDEIYGSSDALLFPSLHDSSGNVVLEALGHGLPVICLDLGGPAVIVNDSCGRRVSTNRRSETASIAALSEAILELSRSDSLRRELSEGALRRADEFLWARVVGGLYDDVEKRLSELCPSVTR